MGKIASLTTSKLADLAGSKAVKCSTKISVKGHDEYVPPLFLPAVCAGGLQFSR